MKYGIVLAALLLGSCALFVAAPGVDGIIAAEKGTQGFVEKGVTKICDFLGGEMQPNGDCEYNLLSSLF